MNIEENQVNETNDRNPNMPDNKPDEKKGKSVKILRYLSTVFLILGVLGLLLPFLNNYLISHNSKFDLSTLSSDEMIRNQKTAFYFPMEQIKEIGYFNFWGDLGKARPSEIIGELHIPSVDIHLPVFHNSANPNLLTGVGMLYPELKMGEGNYAISGHRPNAKGALLHNLMDVEMDRTIYLTDKDKIYVYRIVDTEELDTKAVYMLDEEQIEKYDNRPIVTVMTCYNGKADSRWFVIGELEDVLDYSEEIIEQEWSSEDN